SARISSHDASREASSELVCCAALRWTGRAIETKSAPPIFTNPRREIVAAHDESISVAVLRFIQANPQACIALAARSTASMIAAYVPQRHRCGEGSLLVNASLICVTVGFGFFASSSTATIIMPLWQ